MNLYFILSFFLQFYLSISLSIYMKYDVSAATPTCGTWLISIYTNLMKYFYFLRVNFYGN